MVSKWVRRWIALGLIGAATPVTGALGQEVVPETAPPIPSQALPQESAQERADNVFAFFGDLTQAGAAAAEEAPPSDYYIGIALGELPELVRTQLKLEHGLVVEDVIEGSPAEKAEFKVQDILILADETKVAEPADILKAVDGAKEKEMKIVVLRDGKELSLKVTPAKRPKPEADEVRKTETLAARVPASAIQRIEEALRELKGEDGAARSLELYFPRAGVVAPRVQTLKVAELPKNLKISITRDGDGPAKIHVVRDDKEWDTTDDKLGELPADVRGHVEQMLSKVIHPMLSARARALIVGGPKGAYSPGTQGAPAVVPYPGAPAIPGVQVAPPVPATAPATVARLHAYRVVESKGGSLESKVDQILKKLSEDDDSAVEKLRDEVDRLRKEVEALKNK